MIFLAFLFIAICAVQYLFGASSYHSITTSISVSAIYLISSAVTYPIGNRYIKSVFFIIVFTALPLYLLMALAKSSDLTRRVDGTDIFIDGKMTAEGMMKYTIPTVVMAIIIVIAKEIYLSKIANRR